MKKISILLSLLLLSACSIAPPVRKPAYTADELAMIKDCRNWVASKEKNKAKQMDKVQGDQLAFVLMHESTMEMISTTFGKAVDICVPGDDYFAAYTAYAKGQTEIATTAMKEIGGVAKTAGYVYGAVKVSENLASSTNSVEKISTTTTTTTTPAEIP